MSIPRYSCTLPLAILVPSPNIPHIQVQNAVMASSSMWDIFRLYTCQHTVIWGPFTNLLASHGSYGFTSNPFSPNGPWGSCKKAWHFSAYHRELWLVWHITWALLASRWWNISYTNWDRPWLTTKLAFHTTPWEHTHNFWHAGTRFKYQALHQPCVHVH